MTKRKPKAKTAKRRARAKLGPMPKDNHGFERLAKFDPVGFTQAMDAFVRAHLAHPAADTHAADKAAMWMTGDGMHLRVGDMGLQHLLFSYAMLMRKFSMRHVAETGEILGDAALIGHPAGTHRSAEAMRREIIRRLQTPQEEAGHPDPGAWASRDDQD